MGFKKGQNPHHPKKGSSTKVDPIRDLRDIAQIKENLAREGKLRDLCLFTLGVNTAWRANELLSITVGQVLYLKSGDILELKQSKTQTYRATPLNSVAIHAIQNWLTLYEAQHKTYFNANAPLFLSFNDRRNALRVPSITTLAKEWCGMAKVPGRFGSHSMRKTWGYHQRVTFGSPLTLISRAYGHSSERETLAYIGVLPQEIDDLYRNEL